MTTKGYVFVTSRFNVSCPSCRKEFITFLPFEGLPNVLCPSCGSLSRHRMIALYLEDSFKRSDKKINILHVAPERSLHTFLSKRNDIQYVNADISPENYFASTIKTDITNTGFDSNQFDLVICNHVLEHVTKDSQALSEFYRILKSGGRAILMVPLNLSNEETYEDFTITEPKERELHFGQHDHVRVYGKDYFERLKKVGFSVLDYDFKLERQDFEKYGIDQREPFVLVEKPKSIA